MIDLHVHSTMSDGTDTPAEIAALAYKKGLQAFALTDHDTISGNNEAAGAAKKYGINFINGMEMSLAYDKHQIHVVALGFDVNNPAFIEYYTNVRQLKTNSVIKIIAYLQQQGVDISPEKVQPYAGSGEMDKYAIMRYLVEKEKVTGNVQIVWDKYLDPAVRALMIAENPPAEYAIKAIKKAGGVTSLAHFHKKIGFWGYSREQQEYHIKYLHSIGLDGMEAYYPNYSDEDKQFAYYLIEKYNLLPTGGTDYHGKNRPAVDLGTGINNNMNVPDKFYGNISKMINR